MKREWPPESLHGSRLQNKQTNKQARHVFQGGAGGALGLERRKVLSVPFHCPPGPIHGCCLGQYASEWGHCACLTDLVYYGMAPCRPSQSSAKPG